MCISYWKIVLSGHAINCIHCKAAQRSGESWKQMEVMMTWGGHHVLQNMGRGGGRRGDPGGQVRENEGREQRWNFSWIARAKTCLPTSSPASCHRWHWALLDNWGSSTTCAFSLLALLDKLQRLQAFLQSWIQQSWLIYALVYALCIKEKREGFHIWISSNYCVSQVKLPLFFLSSFSAKFKGQPCLVSWKMSVIIKGNIANVRGCFP